MKITIELTEAEVKGLKAYLLDVAEIENANKASIQMELQGIVSSTLHSPHEAVSDYIKKVEKYLEVK